MPKLVSWEQCCGCAACANKCPKQAISMEPNHEGFLHPVVDEKMCVECGACEKVCSGLSLALNQEANPKSYVVQHKDAVIRYQSTSGGAFTALAEEVIRRGGVVFGAVMTESLTVKHTYVEDLDGLAKFRNSKYVQSAIGRSYTEAKEFLEADRYVCFSGTPCQINGLYKFLGKNFEKLVSIDVVCKSVPSPLVFAKYVDLKSKKEQGISDIVFRDKKRGFLYCTMAHYKTHEDRREAKAAYRRGSESDEWLRLFLSGKIARRSCMMCPYQTKHRVGDFTLGDIWETGNAEWDDNKGTTLVHVWTEKGVGFLYGINSNIKMRAFPEEKLRGIERTNIIKLQPNRVQMFNDAYTLDSKSFFSKYSPNNVVIGIRQMGRYLSWRFHLHNMIRHIKHRIIH